MAHAESALKRARPVRPAFADAWARSADCEGWLTRAQGQMLWDAATSVSPGTTIVEIGSHHGRSTIVLASACRPGVRVLAIDPWEDPRWGGGSQAMQAFLENVERTGVRDRIEVMRGTSAEIRTTCDDLSVGLLFIDGAHDLPSVLQDIDGWVSLVAVGGSVLIHDAFSSRGVTNAILRRFVGRGPLVYRGSAGSLARFVRLDATPAQSAASSARLVMRLPWYLRNLAVKVAIRRRWPIALRALRHRDAHDPY